MRWFELLVEGISKSEGIAHSLEKIYLLDWDIKQEEAQEVVQRFKLNKVEVINGVSGSLFISQYTFC